MAGNMIRNGWRISVDKQTTWQTSGAGMRAYIGREGTQGKVIRTDKVE